jgi:hypothetical protein
MIIAKTSLFIAILLSYPFSLTTQIAAAADVLLFLGLVLRPCVINPSRCEPRSSMTNQAGAVMASLLLPAVLVARHSGPR